MCKANYKATPYRTRDVYFKYETSHRFSYFQVYTKFPVDKLFGYTNFGIHAIRKCGIIIHCTCTYIKWGFQTHWGTTVLKRKPRDFKISFIWYSCDTHVICFLTVWFNIQTLVLHFTHLGNQINGTKFLWQWVEALSFIVKTWENIVATKVHSRSVYQVYGHASIPALSKWQKLVRVSVHAKEWLQWLKLLFSNTLSKWFSFHG